MIHIVHTVCGGTAFFYDKKPEPGEVIRSSRAKLLDGEAPENNSAMKCGACGRPIWNPQIELRVGDEVKLGDGNQKWDEQPWA